jgi:hypothetical protein
MAVSDSPPGLWAVRNQRRRTAMARDMLAIQGRLDTLAAESSITNDKLDVLTSMITKLLVQDSPLMKNAQCKVQEVSSRVGRMKMLLLQASLEEFAMIDNQIASVLPKIDIISEKPCAGMMPKMGPRAEIELPFVPAFPHKSRGNETHKVEGLKQDLNHNEGEEQHDESQDDNQDKFHPDGGKQDETHVQCEKHDENQNECEKQNENHDECENHDGEQNEREKQDGNHDTEEKQDKKQDENDEQLDEKDEHQDEKQGTES